MDIINITIPLDTRTKKNGCRITRGKFPKLLPSPQYVEWCAKAKAYIAELPGDLCSLHISEPVNIKAIYYMQTRRRVDITNLHSAISDMLVEAGVLLDDNRDICAAYDGSRVYYDKTSPRCEIEISPLDDDNYKQWKEPDV